MGENIKGYDPLAICGCKSETDCPAPITTEHKPTPPNYLLYFIIGIAIVIVLGMLVYIRKL